MEDKRLLWEKKAFCQAESAALPLVLASAPCWEWACLPEIYALLRQWACLGHLDALGLLHASYVLVFLSLLAIMSETGRGADGLLSPR